MNKPRVVIITQEEPFFIPKFVRYVLKHQNLYEVVGFTCLKPHRKNKSMKDWFLERTKIYTVKELLITGFCYLFCKFWQLLISPVTGKNYYSVKKSFAEKSVPHLETPDVNARDYISRLKNLDVHIILSMSPPQLFNSELLSVPSRYCLNAHGTLLPRHRGVFGSWWTLFENDKEAGATIHTMEEKLDAGNILWQHAFPLSAEDTQYSIAFKTKQLMASGFTELMKNINNNQVNEIPPSYNSSYHKAPNKKQGEAFHKKGLNIILMKDIKYAIKSSFD